MKNLGNTHVVYNAETREYEIIDLVTGEVASSSGNAVMQSKFVYNLKLAKYICQRIAEGATIKKLCAEDGMPSASVIASWRSRHPDFDEAIKEARRVRAEYLHDTILETAEDLVTNTPDKDGIAAAKTAIDAWKWAAEKNDRESFGPGKVEQGSSGPATIVINTGITRQKKEPTEVIDGSVRRGNVRRETGTPVEAEGSGRKEEA